MNIEINKLKKSYNSSWTLFIDKLNISTGEIVGIIGNNGAGKTTFIHLILDLIKRDCGIIEYRNKINILESEWKKYVGSYLGFNSLIDFLTPMEYFYFIAYIYGIDIESVLSNLSHYNAFLNNLSLFDKKYISEYSTGNKQKIGIVSALLVNPQLLILDEPFNFLDPISQVELNKIIKNINTELNTTIIISSHNIEQIASISSRIILLDNGHMINDFKDNKKYSVSELYDCFKIIHKNNSNNK